MADVDLGRELRLGILAVEEGLLGREDLLDVLRAWSQESGCSLGQVLVDRGGISSAELDRLEQHLRIAGATTLAEVEPASTLALDPAAIPWGSLPGSLHLELKEASPGSTAGNPLPGTLGGRFVRRRLHARGGLGEVLIAVDQELNREVALKVIREGLADDPNSRTRFWVEAEITGNLEHPGIVPVYSLGRDAAGRPYYAMRFVQGETLHEAVERYRQGGKEGQVHRGRSIELRQFLRHFLVVCETLSYAHSRGVLHRDIKPSNVLLGRFGETLVVDWGLAKPLVGRREAEPSRGADQPVVPTGSGQGIETIAGTTIGTPGFMSPEQAAGRLDQLSPASDVYSLGAMLYFLLCGRPPIDDPNIVAAIHRTIHGDIEPPRRVDRSTPRALEAICMKALATAPADRYPSARALGEDLERWLADAPVSARREPWLERGARWLRRHRTTAVIGGAALLLVTIISSVATTIVHSAWRQEQGLRIQADNLAAELMLDEALEEFHDGNPGRGMIQLVRTLRAIPPDHPALREVTRANLAAWGDELSPLSGILPDDGYVNDFDLSRDRKALLTAGYHFRDGAIQAEARLWDATTLEPMGPELIHGETTIHAALSPDLRTAVTAGEDGRVLRFNPRTGESLGPPSVHGGLIRDVAFTPAGETFATAGADGLVHLWSTSSGMSLGTPLPHPAPVLAVAFSPDGARLATGDRDGGARVWDWKAEPPRVVAMVQHRSPVWAIGFAPGNRAVASAGAAGTIRFWDPSSGEPLSIDLSTRSAIYAMALSPDNRMLITGGEDNNARLWDLATGSQVGLPIEHLGSVLSVGFRADGRSVITANGDGRVRVWDLPEPRSRTLAQNRIGWNALVLSPDGQRVLLIDDDGGAELHEVETGRLVGDRIQHPRGAILCAAFRSDGLAFATGGEDGQARLWNGATGRREGAVLDHGKPIRAIAFRPGSGELLTGGDDGWVRIWRTGANPTSRAAFSHPWPITALAVSPDGGKAVSAAGITAQAWAIDTSQMIGSPLLRDGTIFAVAFHPDGRRVAIGGEDNLALLWDLDQNQLIGTPLRHNGSVAAVAFSPDGRTLATAGGDHTSRLWDLATGKPIGPPLTHQDRVAGIAFLPDGRGVVTASLDGLAQTWQGSKPPERDLDRLGLWVEQATGFRLNESRQQIDGLRSLSREEWNRKRTRVRSDSTATATKSTSP